MQVYPNSWSWSLFTSIASDSVLVSSGVTVQLEMPPATDPGLLPWVGVYWNGMPIEAHQVAAPVPWRVTPNFTVLARGVSGIDLQDATKEAINLLTQVLTTISSVPQLGGLVDDLEGWSVEEEEVLGELGPGVNIRGYVINLMYSQINRT